MNVTIPDIKRDNTNAFINSESFKYLGTKRCIDLAIITLALPLVIIISVITAIAIKLESSGAVFFWQKRQRVLAVIFFGVVNVRENIL